MENNELNYQGLILDENTISEADYIIGADDKIEIPVNTNTKRFFYNQGKLSRTRNACGLFASAGTISDLTGYEFSEEELLEIVDLAEAKYGWSESGGMYMSRGVDCLRNYWNTKFPDNQLKSFRFEIGDKLFVDSIKKKHSLAVGYKTSSEYYKDSQDDGILQGEDFPKGGGHLVRSQGLDNVIKIDDNYFGIKKYNTYENNNIFKLKDNGVFFPSAYLFLYDNTMKDQIRDNIDLEGAKIMFDLKQWNGLSPREKASRQELMQVEFRQREYIDEKFAELKKYIDNK